MTVVGYDCSANVYFFGNPFYCLNFGLTSTLSFFFNFVYSKPFLSFNTVISILYGFINGPKMYYGMFVCEANEFNKYYIFFKYTIASFMCGKHLKIV